MLWSFALPIQITIGILFALTIILTLVAPLIRCSRFAVFLAMVFISGVAFLPLCSFVYKEVGRYRFGTFQYATAADISDYHFEVYMPPTATSITTDQYEMGHRARFTIEEVDLKKWLDDSWSRYGDTSVSPRSDEHAGTKKEELEKVFEGLNWQLPDDAVPYPFPVAANGASVSIWYDPATKTAYTRAGYW